ncbi:MAG: G5 domain-containing protein [Armatimonadota bacterium]
MRRPESRHAVTIFCVAATLAVCFAVATNRTDVAHAESSGLNVTLTVDRVEHHIRTNQTTVGAVIKEAGIVIGPADLVCPKPNVRLYKGIKIRVVQAVDKVQLVKEPIRFTTKRQPTHELRVGLTRTVSEGEPGLKHLYYKVHYVDGVEKKRELVRAEVVVRPKDRVVQFGDRGAGVSRGIPFTSKRVLRMTATAYDPGPRSCGRSADGRTCLGMKAGYGVVAVDPAIIPLRSRLYIEGYGFAIAGDRGRAIKGHRIDLGYDTYAAAKRFGRKMVTVHILE